MLRKMAGVWKTPPAGNEEQAVAFLSSNQPKLEPHLFLQFLVNTEAGKNDNSMVNIIQVGFTFIAFEPRARRRELLYFRNSQDQVVLVFRS